MFDVDFSAPWKRVQDGEYMRAACKVISQKMTALGVAVVMGMLACCSAPSSYMGIEFAPVAATATGQSELQLLARRAQSGDKQAQLELGIRFEEGRGVARDLKKARKLYANAAKDSGGTVMVYSPPVGNGTSGRVMPVNAAPKQFGLAEAKRRLGELE